MNQRLKFGILGLLFGIVIVLFWKFDIGKILTSALSWIGGLGWLGVIVFIMLYILATVFFLPGTILTLGAGLLFGVVWGVVYVSIASVLGATLAFLLGRYFARDWVKEKIGKNEKFKAIDDAVGREGWKIVGLTRLSPIFPFNLLNYSYGLTKVKLKDYFFASWIGMLPGTILYVYIGGLAGELAQLGSGGRSPAEWGFLIFGLLVTVVVTFYVTHLARRALDARIQS